MPRFAAIGFLLTLFAVPNHTAPVLFDLAADWSDTSNPNGVWSYNKAPGQPLTTHQADWNPARNFSALWQYRQQMTGSEHRQ